MIQTVIVKDVFETYSYFYIDDKTKHGFLIDPGAEADKLLALIDENNWVIEKILLTHGHFDHIGAVEKVSQRLGIPYLIHQNGADYLLSTTYNLASYCDRHIILPDAVYIEDGDSICLEANPAFRLQVIHTPGHTTDSVVYYSKENKIAFVGDTIFKAGIGNTGYPGGNMEALQDSILHRIFSLPQETRLLSGHSEMTTVGTEIARYIR